MSVSYYCDISGQNIFEIAVFGGRQACYGCIAFTDETKILETF